MAKKKTEKEEGQEGHGVTPADEKGFGHGEKQAALIAIWKKHPDWTGAQVGAEFQKRTSGTVSAPTISKAKAKALGNGNGGDEAASTAAVTRRPGRPPAGAHIEIGEGGAKETGDQVSLDAVRQVRQLVERYGYTEVRQILMLFTPKP